MIVNIYDYDAAGNEEGFRGREERRAAAKASDLCTGGAMNRTRKHNPNCDGSHCLTESGEVRLYPLGGGANLILCAPCFAHENQYRRERGRETGAPENWPQVDWTAAKRYPEDDR